MSSGRKRRGAPGKKNSRTPQATRPTTIVAKQTATEAAERQPVPAQQAEEAAGRDAAATPAASGGGTDWQGTNWVKKYFVEVMPALSLSLFFLAFIYNVAYYSAFNFNFIPYISFSESLFLIIDPLISVTFASLILTGSCIIFLNHSFIQDYTQKWILKAELLVTNEEKERDEIKQRLKDIQDGKAETVNLFSKMKFWHAILAVIILLVVSYIILLLAPVSNNGIAGGDYGLHFATIGLIIPFVLTLLISIGVYFADLYLYPRRLFTWTMMMHVQSISARRWFGLLFLYYIYAIFIFYKSGLNNANHNMYDSPVTFEIKASDGQIYDNSGYTYFGQMGGRVFLLDKQTGGNVVINAESAAYTKISSKEGNNFVIVSTINVFSDPLIKTYRSSQKARNKKPKTTKANGRGD